MYFDTTMDRGSKKGLEPGSLVYIGEKKSYDVQIIAWHYDETEIEKELLPISVDWTTWQPNKAKTWIEINGIHNPTVIAAIGSKFQIDHLVLEDIMNAKSRTKIDEYDHYLFLCLKAIDVKRSQPIHMEQFSLIVGENIVISFQEEEGDCFHSIRDRLNKAKSKMRSNSSFYLAYALLDSIVDDYLLISEQFGKRIEVIESILTKQIQDQQFKMLLQIRRELLDFKRSIDPTKEVIHLLAKKNELETKKYFVDLYDHILFVSENLQFHRELLSNSMELYHSLNNHHTNQIMRLLTIITTIFVPLTFIVGVYGMNFDVLPELHWKYGYLGVWSFMVLLIILQIWWFKKNRWIGK